MSALSSFTPGGVAGVFNFNVTGAPPFTTLKTFINGIDYSPLVAPDSTGAVGSPLITDRSGAVSGKLTVIKTYGGLSVDGSLDVSFYDPSTKLTVSRFSIAGVDSAPDTVVDSTRSSSTITSITSSTAETDIASAAKLGGVVSVLTPFTQTFFVDGTKYPTGIFVSSIELWFATKDNIAPVSIQLRQVIGGVPSSNEIIPGSVCVVNAANVNVPANAIITTSLTSASAYTKFPILSKLPPGEYGISIVTDSKEYSIYSSVFGQPGPGGSGIAQKEPYIGKLFKSQNTNTWLEESNKSLCFAVNKAQFYKGTAFFELQTEVIPSTVYDSVFLDSATTGEGEVSGINYTINTVNDFAAPGTLSGAIALPKNQPLTLDKRKKAIATGDIKIGVTFTNNSLDSSPVLDKSRLSLYTFANEIDPYEADTRSAELLPSNGIARSRYISKVITLATGFDSTGLEVKLDVNRKIGTDIDVFCRVMSSTDINTNNSIDNLPWKRMPLYNKDATVTAPDSIEGKKSYAGSEEIFYTEIYKILETDTAATTGFDNLYYTALVGDTLATFKDFNKFQIKVVFYSFDSTIVPKIKNLIATAVI
jgi:hypothetical protein